MACRFDDKTTIKTNTKEKDGDITEDPVIHYVPFKVEYDGPANVKDKFTDLVKPSSFVLSGDRQERGEVKLFVVWLSLKVLRKIILNSAFISLII